MKMKKLFAGLVATTIVAAGTSAFAAPVANDAGFNKEAGTYSIAAATAETIAGYGSDQTTIIIIPQAAYDLGTINDADILYIDQAAADTEDIFTNVGILGGTELTEGTYYVKIGGEKLSDNGIIVEKFTVTKEAGSELPYLYGDVNGSTGYPDLDDAMEIIKYYMWEPSVLDDGAAWRMDIANVTSDRDINESVDLDDAMEIIKYYMWEPSNLDNLLPAE